MRCEIIPTTPLLLSMTTGFTPPTLIVDLLTGSRANPGCIISGLGRRIGLREDGKLLPYNKWRHVRNARGPDILPLGFSGVLYPPGSLHEDVTRDDIFTALAPTTDDLWFKVMAVLNSTPAVALDSPRSAFMEVYRGQPSALWRHNQHGVNDANMVKLMQHYGLTPECFGGSPSAAPSVLCGPTPLQQST